MSQSHAAGESKYVTFKLDAETYALPISQVREVLEFKTVTKVPKMPSFVRGVINLRGMVLPVVDMRQIFNLGRTEKTSDTRVMVVEVVVDGERTTVGALADAVRDVVDFDEGKLSPPPKIGARLHTEFIRAVGRNDEDFVLILDMDRVFSRQEFAQLTELEPAQLASELRPEAASGG